MVLTMKKLIVVVLILSTLVCSLVACNRTEVEETLPDGAVPVLSNYPYLTYILPGEYEIDKYGDSTWGRNGYSTFVSEVDGQLAIMPAHTCGSSKAPMMIQSDAYQYDDITGSCQGVFHGDDLIIPEKCVGMFSDWNRLLVFTTTDSTGKIYAFEREDDTSEFYLIDEHISIEGEITLVYYTWKNFFYTAPEKVYILTSQGVVILELSVFLYQCTEPLTSMTVRRLEVPSWWTYMRPNNGTQTKDGTIWIGDREGVIRINTDDSMEYYPIDYSKATVSAETE